MTYARGEFFLGFAGLGLGLAACTVPTAEPVTSLPSSAKTVVIVPALPATLNVATLGFSVFGNNLDTPSIVDWHLQDLVYAQAAQALSPRYQVSEALPDTTVTNGEAQLETALDQQQSIVQLFPQLVHVQAIPDLYLLIRPSTESHPPDLAPLPFMMQDIGASAWAGFTATSRMVMAHAFLEVTIIDGHTLQVLGEAPLSVEPGSNLDCGELCNSAMPERQLKDFYWHENWADMTPDQQALVRSTIESLLNSSVNYTVKTAFNLN